MSSCYYIVATWILLKAMRVEVYIFGNFTDGYSQYPDDYTRNLFKTVSSSRKSISEIVYCREGSLTYYMYMREISRSSNSFIGLCYVFNGIIIRDFSYLFDIFEDAITNLVVKGDLLEFTDDGNLITKVKTLYTNQEEIQRVADFLNSKINSLGGYAEKLPPANFAISNTEWKSYDHTETGFIKDAINVYSNIRVIKGENYDSKSLKGFAAKLKSKDDSIKRLQKEIDNLKGENVKLNRQKKQFTFVLILLLLLVIGVVAFTSQLNSKNEIIQRKNSELEQLERHRYKLQVDSANLTISLNETNESLRVTNNKLKQLREEYKNLQNEKDDLVAANDSLGQTIDQLINRNSELERKVSDLKRQLSTNYSVGSFTIGPSNSHFIGGHDNTYAQWLYATKQLRINYFYVHPNKSGNITIGLYNSNGSLVSSCNVYVYANQWNKISPNNFVLSDYSKYYLAIKEANGISLSYHNSTSSEYSNYKNSSLQILGSCSKGKFDYGTSYYQYFYSINYSIIN